MAADLKRLKGTYDLAQLNHSSLKTDDTEAALEAAKNAYEAAAEVADQEGTGKHGGIRNDGPVDDKQAMSTVKPVVKKAVAKASTSKTDGDEDNETKSDTDGGGADDGEPEKKSSE